MENYNSILVPSFGPLATTRLESLASFVSRLIIINAYDNDFYEYEGDSRPTFVFIFLYYMQRLIKIIQ